MEITDIQFKKTSFRFTEPVHVAFGTIEGYETMIIRIDTDNGITGYGEAGPLGFVTGDNLDTCMIIAAEYKKALIGENPLAIERIHKRMDEMYNYNTSVKAAFDIACYDIAAKNAGLPLYRYLGGDDPHIESDMTISMNEPEKMAADTDRYRNQAKERYSSVFIFFEKIFHLSVFCLFYLFFNHIEIVEHKTPALFF